MKAFFLMFTIYGICEAASVTLKKRGNSDTIVCPNDIVFYQCVTTNTTTLSWMSVEYIGSRAARYVVGEHMPGDGSRIELSGMMNFVQLLRIDNSTAGLFDLTSELRIEADPGITSATFTCINEEGNMTSLHYNLSDSPHKPTFTSEKENSLLQPIPGNNGQVAVYRLEWIPPSNVEQFTLSYYEICLPNKKYNISDTVTFFDLMLDISDINTAERAVVELRAFSMCGQPSPTDNITLFVPAASPGVQHSGAKLKTLVILFISLLVLIL